MDGNSIKIVRSKWLVIIPTKHNILYIIFQLVTFKFLIKYSFS